MTATTRTASRRSDLGWLCHRDSDTFSTWGAETEYGIVGSTTGTPLIGIATGARLCHPPRRATVEAVATAFDRLVRADATETETHIDYLGSVDALISTRQPTHRPAVVVGSTPTPSTVSMV